MLKRLLLGLAAVAFALPLLGNNHRAQAATVDETATRQIILHKRVYRDIRAPDGPNYQNDGLLIDENDPLGTDVDLMENSEPLNDVTFEVYDASELYAQALAEGKTRKEFVDEYSNMSRKDALAWARENLTRVGSDITTATDAVLGDGIASITVNRYANGGDAAYLFIESRVDEDTLQNIDIEAKSAPLMIPLPVSVDGEELTDIHLYPKNVGYVRDPYFFKYGITAAGENIRLQGAVFALFRYDEEGNKLYLSLDKESDLKNEWINTDEPLTHPTVNLFVSDENGLVDSGPRFFPAGTYYFEELQPAAGYLDVLKNYDMTDLTGGLVKVVIPDTWDEMVTVAGQDMSETESGIVTQEAIASGFPRVYNIQSTSGGTTTETPGGGGSTTTGTGSSSNNPGKQGWLPALGGSHSWLLVVLGFLLMIATWQVTRRRELRRN